MSRKIEPQHPEHNCERPSDGYHRICESRGSSLITLYHMIRKPFSFQTEAILPKRAIAALKAHRKRQAAERLTAGFQGGDRVGEQRPCIPDDHGAPRTVSSRRISCERAATSPFPLASVPTNEGSGHSISPSTRTGRLPRTSASIGATCSSGSWSIR